ncbi:MAG: EamA family transporter [Candidatus Woesearchaeota archaeon]
MAERKKQGKKILRVNRAKTSRTAIILVIICTLLSSLGQLSYKLALMKSENNLVKVIFNPLLYLGLFSYFIGALLLIFALKQGELSTVYPFIALGFVWVSFFSVKFLNERISVLRWFGIILIISGLILITRNRTESG